MKENGKLPSVHIAQGPFGHESVFAYNTNYLHCACTLSILGSNSAASHSCWGLFSQPYEINTGIGLVRLPSLHGSLPLTYPGLIQRRLKPINTLQKNIIFRNSKTVLVRVAWCVFQRVSSPVKFIALYDWLPTEKEEEHRRNRESERVQKHRERNTLRFFFTKKQRK